MDRILRITVHSTEKTHKVFSLMGVTFSVDQAPEEKTIHKEMNKLMSEY